MSEPRAVATGSRTQAKVDPTCLIVYVDPVATASGSDMSGTTNLNNQHD
jgi:hypothetical protein